MSGYPVVVLLLGVVGVALGLSIGLVAACSTHILAEVAERLQVSLRVSVAAAIALSRLGAGHVLAIGVEGPRGWRGGLLVLSVSLRCCHSSAQGQSPRVEPHCVWPGGVGGVRVVVIAVTVSTRRPEDAVVCRVRVGPREARR